MYVKYSTRHLYACTCEYTLDKYQILTKISKKGKRQLFFPKASYISFIISLFNLRWLNGFTFIYKCYINSMQNPKTIYPHFNWPKSNLSVWIFKIKSKMLLNLSNSKHYGHPLRDQQAPTSQTLVCQESLPKQGAVPTIILRLAG